MLYEIRLTGYIASAQKVLAAVLQNISDLKFCSSSVGEDFYDAKITTKKFDLNIDKCGSTLSLKFLPKSAKMFPDVKLTATFILAAIPGSWKAEDLLRCDENELNALYAYEDSLSNKINSVSESFGVPDLRVSTY